MRPSIGDSGHERPGTGEAAAAVSLRRPIAGIYAFLIAANLAAWAWAVAAFRDHPLLLGTAFLAYGFGLRHAVDADHIAAIDNATRKLMQTGRRPVGVGLFFALGHASVVALAAAAVAGGATATTGTLARFAAVGSVIGTVVSAAFLFAIAAANLFILRGAWRGLRRVRRGGRHAAADVDRLFEGRGLLALCLRPLLRLVGESWQMYPVGFLFGLGFDTATEIALLAVSAGAAAKGVSIGTVMVFPALFAAGMALVDTSDGILMLRAYHWAFVDPVRKLYYNLVITAVSVVVAVLIGGIEALGLVGDRLGLTGVFWNGLDAVGGNFTILGVAVIGLFIAAWGGSVLVYRCLGLGETSTEG